MRKCHNEANVGWKFEFGVEDVKAWRESNMDEQYGSIINQGVRFKWKKSKVQNTNWIKIVEYHSFYQYCLYQYEISMAWSHDIIVVKLSTIFIYS